MRLSVTTLRGWPAAAAMNVEVVPHFSKHSLVGVPRLYKLLNSSLSCLAMRSLHFVYPGSHFKTTATRCFFFHGRFKGDQV